MGRIAKKIVTGRHGKNKRKTVARRGSTALVPPQEIQQESRRPQLSREEVDLLKQTVCKGITDAEFAMFLWVAKKHKLDPMTRQLHAVKRWVKKHHQDEKGIWIGGEQMSIQIGIDGYRSMAAVGHSDFGGVDEPEYEFAKAGDKIPVMARVRVWKKGFDHPSVGVAYWDEYAPSDEDKAFMWRKMPKHMLAKCAEALALRRAYPDLADIYTDEEMHQHDQDYTPEGRQIVTQDGTAPSGRPVTFEARQRTQLDENAAHGHLLGSEKAKQAEATLARVEEEDRKLKEAKRTTEASKPAIDIKPSQKQPESQPEPVLEAEAVGPDQFIVRGDVGQCLPMIEHYCRFFDGWWRCNLANMQEMQTLQKKFTFRLNVLPAQSPKSDVKETSAKKPTSAGASTKGGSAEPELVTGAIERVTVGMTSRNAPTRQVKIGKAWYTSYVNTIFDFLDKGVGKEAEVYVDARKNIVGLKRIGKTEFDTDGRTPCVQRDREPGTPSMFDK